MSSVLDDSEVCISSAVEESAEVMLSLQASPLSYVFVWLEVE